MKRILDVFWYELGRNLRRRGYLFSTFGLPLLAVIIVFGYQLISAGGGDGGEEPAPDPFDIGIARAGFVDESGLLAGFEATEALISLADRATADAALVAGEIDGYYFIAADYLDTGAVTLVLPRLNLNQITGVPIRNALRDQLSTMIDPELARRLQNPALISAVDIDGAEPQAGNRGNQQSFAVIYFFAFALLLSLFMTNGYLMQGVIEEKESRIVEILLVSLRPIELLTGKMLAFGLLGMLQMLVWLSVMIALISAAPGLELLATVAGVIIPFEVMPLVILYYVLGYLLFATAYGIVGALSASTQEGPQIAVVFTLPAVAPLWFISLFIETPNATLPVLLSLFPITAPIGMIQRVLVTSVPAWQITLSIGLLIAAIVGLLWLAGRLFRVQTLLAGQAPRLRELPRLIRG